MGRAKTENAQVLAGASQLNTKDQHTGRITPALHARAGINYALSGRWVGGSLGIGYEFNTYIRALARTVFADDVADGLCTTSYYNFDIQGMYLTGTFTF